MFSEGVVPSADKALEILDMDSEGPAPGDSGGGGGGEEMVPLKDHPVYSKYFKMLKVGLPIVAVRAKMQQEGVNADFIDKDPEQMVALKDKSKDKPAGGGGEATGGGGGGGGGGGMVAVGEHPKV